MNRAVRLALLLPGLPEVAAVVRPRRGAVTRDGGAVGRAGAHHRCSRSSALGGAAAGAHVVPPSTVVITTPLPGTDAPFEPTAMQSVGVGHETPLSCRRDPARPRVAACHEVPPLAVATIPSPHRRGGVRPRHPDRPAAPGRGARHGAELSGAGGRGLPDDERRALLLAEDRRGRGRSRVPVQRCSPRPTRPSGEEEEHGAAGSPGTPVSKHGAGKHGRTTIAAGDVIPGAPLATLAAVDWVDLLIIGLMLLAAVHGLRLGALVQILTFGGFFLGFLARDPGLGAPAEHRARRRHPRRPRRVLVLLTACALRLHRPRPGHLEQCHGAPAPPGPRRRGPRRRRGRPGRAALRLAGGRRDLVAQQPLHVARRRRGPLRHPALDRSRPARSPVDLQRPADLPQQPGLPPGLLDADPAVDPVRLDAVERGDQARWPTPPCSRPSRSSARPAATSRRVRASSSAPDSWPPTRTSSPARATATPRSSWAPTRTARRPCFFDPSFDLAVLRTDAPLGPGPPHRPQPRRHGAPRPPSSAIPRTGPSPSIRPA